MELRHLRYFVAVAEELSFRRAAERLNVSHSPLNRQIIDMEAELGVKLLARSSRGVSLTQAGRVYLDEVRNVLEILRRAGERARETAQGITGKLRIGTSYGYVDPALPVVIEMLQLRAPKIEIELIQAHAREQFAALEARQLDLACCSIHPPEMDASLEFKCLRRFDQGVLMHPRHRLAMQGKVGLRDLADEPMIILKRHDGPRFYNALLSACADAGFEPRIAREVDSVQTMIGLCAAGLGVAVLTDASIPAHLDIAFRVFEPPLPPFEHLIAWLRDDHDRLVDEFLGILDVHLLDRRNADATV